MKIFLDDDDAPNPADRETAVRIVTEIMRNDVMSRGTFLIEGYSSARRIAQALTAARVDEVRRGFSKPFRMRAIKRARGADAVMEKWPSLRPLHRWLEVDGVRFQYYRATWNRAPLISDDGRIELEERPDFWTACIDGRPVVTCGATRRFDTEIAAARAALERLAKDIML
ncbi:hypothetical protein Hden_2993 [Hyphomicrobium denitrificans ATCC 51888]|uniref:Uncharacterized protein n=1 Tax=Hyphomicrobium denitrificans (strain ATCC 51888 / DSM 1869 / NCIMB 11706 / TK 0415) TaxID=582899 RepID=D8JVD4_HYPDA|nr:hypothetical protein [Hyphomicrobium denitrificans]ADJ24788.1 hypothetical protein Hden_2993 [Hyphomicrobium denitrificans ATCC 51888]